MKRFFHTTSTSSSNNNSSIINTTLNSSSVINIGDIWCKKIAQHGNSAITNVCRNIMKHNTINVKWRIHLLFYVIDNFFDL